jgi:hypothetical protein
MIDGEGTQADEAARGSSTDPNDRGSSSSTSTTESTTTTVVEEKKRDSTDSKDWPEGDPRFLGDVGECGDIGDAGPQWEAAGLCTSKKEEKESDKK